MTSEERAAPAAPGLELVGSRRVVVPAPVTWFTLRPGDRLPPGRELSEQFGVAIMTVRKAIDVLRTEGAVSSQQGRGVFVTSAGAKEPTADLESLKVAVQKLTSRVAALEDAASRRAE